MIILASASPRRAALLTQIGVDFRQQHATIDETPLAAESPEAYVSRLAQQKARALSRQLNEANDQPILAADTAVVVGAEILGKPVDYEHFRAMMVKLSAASHKVVTAISLLMPDGEQMEALSVSKVSFRHLQESEIEAYWHSGEPLDKAGGYAIQGIGAIFVESLAGSYSGVMGLPLFETAQLLKRAGIFSLVSDGESKK